MRYSVENHPPAGLFTFIPSVDGDMFEDRPSVLHKIGRFVKDNPVVFGWTQDNGAMNAGPAHLIIDEDAMAALLRTFAPSLNQDDLRTLFSLYLAADFEPRLYDYNLNKQPGDPEVLVHFFRLSQILRDLLFTCSSLDFAAQSSNARLYVLNQSMLMPIFQAAGMRYIGVPHGSDTNYIFGGLFPEGEVSDADQALGKVMTGALLRFAATRDPNADGDEWLEAFGAHGLNVQTFGGELGTGAASVAWEDQELKDESIEDVQGGEGGGFVMGAMESREHRR